MSETICLKTQLSQEQAAIDPTFSERVCDVTGCALKFYMAHDERFATLKEEFDEDLQRKVIKAGWTEPLSGVARQGLCKHAKDYWLQGSAE
jgi:hypothetical protein